MEKFLTLLSRFEPLSDSFVKALKERVVRSSPPRGHLLLEASHVSSNLYFLKKGFAISFHYNNKRKHIEEFFSDGSIVLSSTSFLQRRPSQESIELLEAGEMFMISYDSVMWLEQRFREARSLYLLPMNDNIDHSKERIHDLQLLNAEERYEKLRSSFPSVFRLIPLEQIATYLGIAPQTLSRIRRESEDYY